jgi:hypothetical protein
MKYFSNTTEVLARLATIRALVAAGVFSDALVAGLNAGMGLMKRRIFNQSLDAEGVGLGPYFSEQYARDRRRSGRQTARKDLEFEGTLRRAIEVVTVHNTKAEIRITNDKAADIARWQEQQIANLRSNRPANEESGDRVPIFELNPTERSVVQTTTRELLRQKFNF